MKKILLVVSFFAGMFSLQAQRLVRGIVKDRSGLPVPGATVLLQKTDSSYIRTAVSEGDGSFNIPCNIYPYMLTVEDIGYRTKTLVSDKEELGTIVLEDKSSTLKEVVIKGNRPLVKAEDGMLSYDLSALASKKVVDNAYEALLQLPGVREDNGTLSLLGAAGSLNVIINGNPTTMSPSQLQTYLKNLPVDRVEKAEVMYSAPPQYHVRGAAINLVIKRDMRSSVQGEVRAGYADQYYSNASAGASLRITDPKTTWDFIYNTVDFKNMELAVLHSLHTLNGEAYDIDQRQYSRHKGWYHFFRGEFDYNLSAKSYLNIVYTTTLYPHLHGSDQTDGNYQKSLVQIGNDIKMHNISTLYKSNFGLSVNMDYTYYDLKNNQNLNTTIKSDGSEESFLAKSKQHIDRYSLTVNEEQPLGKEWTLNYGGSYIYAKENDTQAYSEVKANFKPQDTNSNLNEQTIDFYGSLNKKISDKITFTVSATGEYYTIENYRKWSVYPRSSFDFKPSPGQVFQFSFSTNRNYPNYRAMQSFVDYMDGYSQMQGNPALRPSTVYSLNGNYLLSNKYDFNLFYNRTEDYFMQAAYQSPQELALIYKTMNWNYRQTWGASAFFPFDIGKILSSRLTLYGYDVRERCDHYYDISFDRSRFTGYFDLNNSFKINKSLLFTLEGYYSTPLIQGTYDTNDVFGLNAGMKWTFAKGRATLTAQCNDITDTAVPKVKVRYKGQYLDLYTGGYNRRFSLQFTYSFGGYKEKRNKGVDTSRFGH